MAQKNSALRTPHSALNGSNLIQPNPTKKKIRRRRLSRPMSRPALRSPAKAGPLAPEDLSSKELRTPQSELRIQSHYHVSRFTGLAPAWRLLEARRGYLASKATACTYDGQNRVLTTTVSATIAGAQSLAPQPTTVPCNALGKQATSTDPANHTTTRAWCLWGDLRKAALADSLCPEPSYFAVPGRMKKFVSHPLGARRLLLHCQSSTENNKI